MFSVLTLVVWCCSVSHTLVTVARCDGVNLDLDGGVVNVTDELDFSWNHSGLTTLTVTQVVHVKGWESVSVLVFVPHTARFTEAARSNAFLKGKKIHVSLTYDVV